MGVRVEELYLHIADITIQLQIYICINIGIKKCPPRLKRYLIYNLILDNLICFSFLYFNQSMYWNSQINSIAIIKLSMFFMDNILCQKWEIEDPKICVQNLCLSCLGVYGLDAILFIPQVRLMISDSELSDEFSLDTVGSHGDVKCKGLHKDYLVTCCFFGW